MRIISNKLSLRGRFCAIAAAALITALFTACAGTSDAEATVLAMPGTAQACLDTRLYAVGTRMELVYRSTSGGAVFDSRTQYEVLLPAVYAGVSATRLGFKATMLGRDGVDASVAGSSFSGVQGFDVLNYGTHSTTTAFGNEITADVVLSPPGVRRFSLAIGESFAQRYTVTTTGAPFVLPDESVEVTETFLGFEDITVPAGHFPRACKWQSVQNGVTTTSWDSLFGIRLRTLEPSGNTVLISGSLNRGGLQ